MDMRFPARQLGPVSGAPTSTAFAVIGVVEEGISFHVSARGRVWAGADFWESFLSIAVGKVALLRFPFRHYWGAQRAICGSFVLTSRRNWIEFCREVFLQEEPRSD